MVPAKLILQGVSIKNNPLEQMLYFSHGNMDLSQTFRLFM